MGAWEAAYFTPQRVGCADRLPLDSPWRVEGGLSLLAVSGEGHRLKGRAEVGWEGGGRQAGFSGLSVAQCPLPPVPESVLGRPAWCQVLAWVGMGRGG